MKAITTSKATKAKEVGVKFRGRNFLLLLYPENAEHVEILDKIRSTYEHIYVLHDRDVTDEQQPKKEHWHVIIQFANMRWNTAISKELGLQINFIQEIHNLKSTMQYLVHFNEELKFKYEQDDVKGTNSLLKKFKACLMSKDLDETDAIQLMFDFIFSQGDEVKTSDVFQYACSIGKYDVFRRSYSVIKDLLKEHTDLLLNTAR